MLELWAAIFLNSKTNGSRKVSIRVKSGLTIAKTWIPEKYPAIPDWALGKLRDPFEYKLQSKQEVLSQWKDVSISF